jgi:hypothetical protein
MQRRKRNFMDISSGIYVIAFRSLAHMIDFFYITATTDKVYCSKQGRDQDAGQISLPNVSTAIEVYAIALFFLCGTVMTLGPDSYPC